MPHLVVFCVLYSFFLCRAFVIFRFVEFEPPGNRRQHFCDDIWMAAFVMSFDVRVLFSFWLGFLFSRARGHTISPCTSKIRTIHHPKGFLHPAKSWEYFIKSIKEK